MPFTDQNPPKVHHYVPVFYSKRWASGKNGQLVEFSEPRPGKVVAQRKAPKATGFQRALYEMPGVAVESAQQIEKDFFGPVDNEAGRILGWIEAGGGNGIWDHRDRVHWTRFLMTMQIRNPQDISALKTSISADWLRGDENGRVQYAAIAHAFEWQSYEEFLASVPGHFIERVALRIGLRLMDLASVGQSIGELYWNFVPTDAADRNLLTSDRPVYISSILNDPEVFITMPLGPRRLFVAAKRRETLQRMAGIPMSRLVREINKGCVQRAVTFVYGSDDTEWAFVAKQFGRGRMESQIERMDRLLQEARAAGTLPREYA